MTLLEYIKEKKHILADGAMGTELIKRATFQKCPEEVNLSHPEIFESIASDYQEAGARLLQTATFGASHIRLSQFGLHHDMETINRIAVKSVKKGIEDNTFVNGVLGPCGLPMDNINGEAIGEISQNYRDQAEVLVDEGVDLLSIETVMSLFEAKAALEGVLPVTGEIPVLLSFAFKKDKDRVVTFAGDPFEKTINAVKNSGISFLGVNCGNGFDETLDITQQMKLLTNLPLAVQPNAGIPDSDLNFPLTPQDFEETVKELLKMDVTIIGGCCGTTPDYIKAVKHLFS